MGKKPNPAFALVDMSPGPATTKNYFRSGYRPLGYSDFSNLRCDQMRSEAIAYGKQIGADLTLCWVISLGVETHAVNRTVMDSSGGVITTNATANTYANFNVVGNVKGFGTYNGTGNATTTTYVPPTFHQLVVPETFTWTEHYRVFE
jgi:hypothetical protein